MEKDKMLSFNIDVDLAEKFELALILNKENSEDVITRLMIQYVSDSFSKASKAFTVQPTVRSNYLSDEDVNYAKANRKIPIWALKPQQNNHRILKAFFELEEEIGFVSIDELAKKCSNPTDYPYTFSSDFKGNFAQMKTDASNSHGKVFVVNDDIVEVWDEIKEVLMESKPLFIRDTEGGSRMTKITNEMVEIAYDYAKKVYSNELTRNEGKLEVAKVSGMNAGSAQDFITDFLAMMEGREYHRTMSNYGTTYFLKNIKKDFGDESFLLALEATEKHIKYYNSLGYGQLKAKEEIVKGLRSSK
ncbi:MAG TPA: hypothetical protein DD730_10155 [Desulfosporosinus sp.]|jgi:hypothetical protein|nr:hypothetical protein [Desulfosporosinus sp.]